LPGQQRSFRRLLSALRRYHGALLADPVGSGKTFVALAVAASTNRRAPTACLVPAALVPQWRTVASRLAVPVDIGSHEQAGRGRLPPLARGLVIIDESHRFRNPATRRYGFVAPWLVGRRVLLVTGTPVVNRLDDLLHQLLLGVRDDALSADGLPSLRRSLKEVCGLSALARVVVQERGFAVPRPSRLAAVSPADAQECASVAQAIGRVGRLGLSRHPPTAALVRGVLYRAVGSSPAAILGALRRYRLLLLHARDAQTSGRTPSRADIRRFAGELEEQLVLWPMMGVEQAAVDLDIGDLELLGPIIAESAKAAAEADPKLARLASVVADGKPTLVFVTSRETLRHVRDRLKGPPVAWCTGDRAGLGTSALPRAVVLDWYRAGPHSRLAPSPLPHLIATDVAAEGLDLQRAARVVHYDQPWTPMRLEQREGRAVRLGSVLTTVEVIRFLLPPALEAALRLEQGLSRKTGLPAVAGLGPTGPDWRWREAAAEHLEPGTSVPGVGFVRGYTRGVLAGFTLHAEVGGRTECLTAVAGWMSADGVWSEEAELVSQMLQAAGRSVQVLDPNAADIRGALSRLAGPIRTHLSVAAGRRWSSGDPDPAARRLTSRLRQVVRSAVRRRDAAGLERLERALSFVSGGHTAGEAALVRRLATSSHRELLTAVGRLPAPSPRPEAVEVRLSGVVLFGE
jgi:superfamily II DNA or RNA helicase